MKPLTLQIKGLHSFREKQTIDFAKLCEGGVFGIFGPTGSGKSSILDAMTLALYGKVERAPNNTQGILNHGEDELYVSFTFQLGHGDDRETYEVERTFKRASDIQIRSATCRLIKGTENRVVIADKTNEVNRAVENLLGLSIDDFTRAVVLPQGKFSEFLTLKGAERRQMLQRLFHLEKYGDQLNAKIKDRLTNTKHEIELIEKEQAALGDASEETVESREEELKQVVKALEKTKEKQKQFEQRAQEEKEIFTIQNEKREAEKTLEILQEKEKEMEENEKRLTKAKEAKMLLPFVTDVENSLNELEKNKENVTLATENLTKMNELVKFAEQRFLEIKKKREEEEVPFRRKLEQFQELKKEELELKNEKENLLSIKKELETIEKSLTDLNKLKEKAATELDLYEKKRKEFEEKLGQLIIPIEEKKLVYRGMEEKQRIETIFSQLKELEKEVKQEKEKEKNIELQISKQKEIYENKKNHLLERFKQIFHWYERVCDHEREINKMKRILSNRKVELESKNKHILIASLRKELKEMEPCPVCGSKEHHYEAIDEEHDTTLHIDEMEKIEHFIVNIEQALHSLERLKWELEEFAKKFQHIMQGEDHREELQFAQSNNENIEENESIHVDVFVTKWVEKETRIRKERETIVQLMERIHTEMNEFDEQEELLKEENRNKASVQERINVATEKYQHLKDTYDAQIIKWKEQFSPFDYESMDEKYAEIQAKDEDAEILRKRIENSTPHIQGKQNEINDLTNEIHQWNVKESALRSQLEQREKFFAEKEQRFRKVVGDANIDELILTTNKELQSLINEYEKLEMDWNEKQKQVNELEKQLVSFKEALRKGEEWHKRSIMQWETESNKTSFSSMEDVKNAMLHDEKIKELESMIKQYENEKQAAKVKLEEAERKLAKRSVTEEQMAETNERLAEMKEKLEQLGTEKGKLEGMLEDLKKKVKRFNELEKERKELAKIYSQYDKLDKVFRGKAFVEFIAEEQLIQVSRLASERLHTLTHGRYALEVDSSGGFVIRDDANGGVKRPITTLSGGETFLTSLALALSLSTSIQLKGEHPLEFFFLDEGFGTLDQDLLETVVSALEKLHTDKLAVGVISHVPELKERLPRKINVIPAEPGGRGSRVVMETL